MPEKPRILDQDERDMLRAARKLAKLKELEGWTILQDMFKELIRVRTNANHMSLPEGIGAIEFLVQQERNKGAVNGLQIALSLVDNTITEAEKLASRAGVAFSENDDANPEGEDDEKVVAP